MYCTYIHTLRQPYGLTLTRLWRKSSLLQRSTNCHFIVSVSRPEWPSPGNDLLYNVSRPLCPCLHIHSCLLASRVPNTANQRPFDGESHLPSLGGCRWPTRSLRLMLPAAAPGNHPVAVVFRSSNILTRRVLTSAWSSSIVSTSGISYLRQTTWTFPRLQNPSLQQTTTFPLAACIPSSRRLMGLKVPGCRYKAMTSHCSRYFISHSTCRLKGSKSISCGQSGFQ